MLFFENNISLSLNKHWAAENAVCDELYLDWMFSTHSYHNEPQPYCVYTIQSFVNVHHNYTYHYRFSMHILYISAIITSSY